MFSCEVTWISCKGQERDDLSVRDERMNMRQRRRRVNRLAAWSAGLRSVLLRLALESIPGGRAGRTGGGGGHRTKPDLWPDSHTGLKLLRRRSNTEHERLKVRSTVTSHLFWERYFLFVFTDWTWISCLWSRWFCSRFICWLFSLLIDQQYWSVKYHNSLL